MLGVSTTKGRHAPPPHISTTSAVTNASANALADFFDNLLNHIPLPRWAIFVILAAGGLLIVLCCLCICIKCCCRGKKKKRQKEELISLKGVDGKTTTTLVQPDVGDVDYGVIKQYRGKLLYSLDYSATLSELTVGIKQANSLKAMDLGGGSDPYVKVYILPEKSKTYETKVFKNTLNPVFNELFTFQLPKSTLLKSTAVMKVFDFNRFTKHEIIGELRVQLCNVDWNHVIEEWQDLTEPTKFEEENLGEVCFSLRYVPTASKLTVIILEAKDLKSMDYGGSSEELVNGLGREQGDLPSLGCCPCDLDLDKRQMKRLSLTSRNYMKIMKTDPYVKVQLALDKRKWKKRKTSVKKKTLNPYFNESFTFDVAFDQIQRVNLVISVWDHDAMTRNDAMGKIYLGCDATGNQLRHWADMLSNPRRPVAQWHSLLSAEQVNSTLALKKKIPIPSKLKENPLFDKHFK